MRLLAVLIALSLGGCDGPKTGGSIDERTRTVRLRDQMCQCHDRECATMVDEALAKFDAEKAKRPASNDIDTMQAITDLRRAYATCRETAMATEPPRPAAPKDPTPPPPVEDLPPRTTGAITADGLWNDARTWARDRRTQRVLVKASFAYVDAQGLLDPVDGEIELVFGRVDDSEAKRRIGAKVRPKQAYDDCFKLTNHDRWSEAHMGCLETSAYNPRCSVAQIWQRAIKQRVPAEAVAMITLDVSTKNTASWTFAIEDEPRAIHVQHTFADDCELAVEK